VLTDTPHRPAFAGEFVLWGVGASLGLFGLLRLNVTEAHVMLPLTRLQEQLAASLFGTPILPVEATLACSGADALALCLGAILAYPVPWGARLAGAGGGAALILGLNTLRIGTLGELAAFPASFNTLHVYVWPAVLTLAIAGYVFAWMRLADRAHTHDEPQVGLFDVKGNRVVPGGPPVLARPRPSRRFIVLTVAFLLLFVAASPLYLDSPSILAIASFIAGTAAATLGVIGVSAHAAANVLWTSRGGFLVTQECIVTPLIPIYLAALCAYAKTWRALIVGILATLPIFVALGIVRLLVVALPDVIASPIGSVHAFYQVLLGAVVLFVAARWRHGGRLAPAHALAGIIVGLLFVQVFGPAYTRVVTWHAGTPLDDPQGAIALLPAFQIGLYLALWTAAFVAVGWRRFLAGLTVLVFTQAAGLFGLHALASYSGLTAHVRDIRGWALVAPVVIFAVVISRAQPRR
jgi:exosortase/archaeosortase family protein